MKDEYKICLLIALKNIITIICFTILAIVFNKWWIIFFSIIFWSSITVEGDDK